MEKVCEIGWKNGRLLHPEAQLKRKRGVKAFRRGFGLIFLVFGDQLFSEFLTRFFEIFAYLAHFQGWWKWKKCEKSRSWETWSTIWVQGLREVHRGSFRQKRFFFHDLHEKDFRSSQNWYGQKNSEFLRKGSMTQKKWRSQKVKYFEQIFFCRETCLLKGFLPQKEANCYHFLSLKKRQKFTAPFTTDHVVKVCV